MGQGPPKPSLLWDFGILDMKLRIWIEKAMLLLHIRRLDEDSLARKVYLDQVSNKWPGLVQEVEQICLELDIQSPAISKQSHKVYRNNLVSACHEKNKEMLISECEGKTKCERMLNEDYGRKEYVDMELIGNVRDTYKARFGMLDFADNYKNDRRFAGVGGLCKCKRDRESEPHLLSGQCEVFGEIRASYGDLKDDESLAKFFKEVLNKRDKIDEEAKKRVGTD